MPSSKDSQQFILDDRQCETMGSLAVMLLKRKHGGGQPRTTTENSDEILRVLNYVANCFVREENGDVVATALRVQKGTINIYIAANRGAPTPTDKENGDTFIKLLRTALKGSEGAKGSEVKESKDPEVKASDNTSHILRRGVSHMTHLRFARKLYMIQEMIKQAAVKDRSGDEPNLKQKLDLVHERFNRIVDQWASDGNMERDPALFFLLHKSLPLGKDQDSKAQDGKGSGGEGQAREDGVEVQDGGEAQDGNKCLKDVFKTFTHMICDTESHKDSSQSDRYCSHAYALVGSNFFTTVNDESILMPDYIWIQKLRRRLWRIARYTSDASHFIKTGLPFIRNALGSEGVEVFVGGNEGGNEGRDDEKIKIVWIGERNPPLDHNKPCKMKMNGKVIDGNTYLKELCKKFGYQEPKAEEGLELEWPKKGISPRLHCEIQMIRYLQSEDIQVHKNLIGNSKLMCWSCNEYVREVNKKRGPNDSWVLLGTSNKPHRAWLIPQDDEGEVVVKNIQREVELSVEYLALGKDHHWAGSDGSDSDTGSRDESDDERWEHMKGFGEGAE